MLQLATDFKINKQGHFTRDAESERFQIKNSQICLSILKSVQKLHDAGSHWQDAGSKTPAADSKILHCVQADLPCILRAHFLILYIIEDIIQGHKDLPFITT